jgi:Tetratricopeptide repeat
VQARPQPASPTSQVLGPEPFLTHMCQVSSPCPTPLADPMRRLLRQGGSTLAVVSALCNSGVHAQAAIDPNVAPRAAALERSGERQMAIDLLGRYLATAPDDGRAWFQLGRFYLLDARDWHLQCHQGDPDGLLYLDFAATAFDQAVRLDVDSGVVYRGLAELERSVVLVEDSDGASGVFRAGPPMRLRCRGSSLSSEPTSSARVPRAESSWSGPISKPCPCGTTIGICALGRSCRFGPTAMPPILSIAGAWLKQWQ